MPGAERSIVVNVPPQVLFDVIADYEKYPEFLKEVETVRVVSRNAQGPVVEYTIQLIKKVQYTIQLVESAPDSVSWTLVKSGMMKHNNGGWTLAELPGGRTRATYRLDVGVGRFVPGKIVDKLTGSTLPATLESFKARAESLA